MVRRQDRQRVDGQRVDGWTDGKVGRWAGDVHE